jgi:hypothetical protein
MTRVILAILLLVPFAAAAQAPAPRSIADCEKITGDLAYNQCLAMFGPARGEPRPRIGAQGAGDEPVVTRSRGGGRYAYRGRRGRQRASFDIGSRRVQAAAGTKVRAQRPSRAKARSGRRRR